jgi:hypothetical protein
MHERNSFIFFVSHTDTGTVNVHVPADLSIEFDSTGCDYGLRYYGGSYSYLYLYWCYILPVVTVVLRYEPIYRILVHRYLVLLWNTVYLACLHRYWYTGTGTEGTTIVGNSSVMLVRQQFE